MDFKAWLVGDMGTPGEYMYTAIHWWTVAAVAAAMAGVCVLAWLWRDDQQKNRRLLKAVAVFQLGFEVLWRLVYVLVKGDGPLCWWPTYPCNLGGILLPVAALMRLRHMKRMFYLFGFVGGVLTFALPEGIFCTDVFVFPVLKSVLQHTGLLLIPGIEFVSGTFRPKLKWMGWVILGCLIHILNCEVIDRLLGFMGDYMFFRSGMPFVIPGVPQYITLSVFAVLVLAGLSALCEIPGRRNRLLAERK